MSFRIGSFMKEAVDAKERRAATPQPASSKAHGHCPPQPKGARRERNAADASRIQVAA